jgi:cardiolipin synthase
MIDQHFRQQGHEAISPVRMLADQAFSRAAGAPLVPGNSIRLLKDAAENYPAWLEAIRSAQHTIYFERWARPRGASGTA